MSVESVSSSSNALSQWQLLQQQWAQANGASAIQGGSSSSATSAAQFTPPPRPPPGPPADADAVSDTSDPSRTGTSSQAASATQLITDLQSFLVNLQSTASATSTAASGTTAAADSTTVDAGGATTSSAASSGSTSDIVTELESFMSSLGGGVAGYGVPPGPPPPPPGAASADTDDASASAPGETPSAPSTADVSQGPAQLGQILNALQSYAAQTDPALALSATSSLTA